MRLFLLFLLFPSLFCWELRRKTVPSKRFVVDLEDKLFLAFSSRFEVNFPGRNLIQRSGKARNSVVYSFSSPKNA